MSDAQWAGCESETRSAETCGAPRVREGVWRCCSYVIDSSAFPGAYAAAERFVVWDASSQDCARVLHDWGSPCLELAVAPPSTAGLLGPSPFSEHS